MVDLGLWTWKGCGEGSIPVVAVLRLSDAQLPDSGNQLWTAAFGIMYFFLFFLLSLACICIGVSK